MSEPTVEQKSVINSTDPEMKVLANAGSGKTYTIMQRIKYIIKNGSSRLDQLLVLTFTDASAQDMRKKLKAQLGDSVSPVELQAVSIGAFHGFCSNIVRAWFSVAEVSPSFVVMDEVESKKIKANIFEQVVMEHYHEVMDVVDLFAVKRTLDELRQVVFDVQAFLETREDRQQWLKDKALKAYEPDINQNPAVIALIDYYHQTANKYRQYFLETGNPSPCLDCVVELANKIIAAKSYQDFSQLDLEVPRANLKGQSDEFKTLRENFRDNFCDSITKQFQFPAEQIQSDIEHDRTVAMQLLHLVQIFDEVYSAKKVELKKLDYSDLEKYALKVLANPEAVASIRAQFKYIFVDEGQDTNPVQFKIINILRGDDKFFCIVGDIKQSIYGFRNCEPEVFQEMNIQARYLNRNFRSESSILHFVNLVMKPLISDYELEHKFTAIGENDLDAMKKAVSIETCHDLNSQMELVYQKILEYTQKDKFDFQDIAILCEVGTHFEALKKYLVERGVPSVIDRATSALEEPEIYLLNHFLFASMNPTNTLSRYIALKYFFHFSNDELACLQVKQVDAVLAQKIAQADEVFTRYRCLCRTQSTFEVLTQVATEFGMLELPIVNTFLTSIRGIKDFDTVARYLYLVEHKLIKIEINVGANVKNAVRLMTIHHSKGLEFPVVILFNMGASWSRQNSGSSKIALDKELGLCVLSVDTDNYVQKSSVLRLGIKTYREERELREKIRLLYVALTRARNKMLITGCWKRENYKIQPNSMLDLINPLGVINHEELEISPQKSMNTLNQQHSIKVCPVIGNSDTLVKQSVTALATVVEPFQDYVAPAKFSGEGGKDFGTNFHREVQYGDLPDLVQSLVNGYTVYRELPFLYVKNQTIVQGIMDLLAVKGNQAIIVDYKTTRLPKENLVTKYREQLRLYAEAIPEYQVQTYIYSTVHNALIEVVL
ncbi:MAG: UvrD-helicase domain-containing protein [Clostridia bacterium]|nr:UvrD-helicase domain-containing protein [Clostridia bacterium]